MNLSNVEASAGEMEAIQALLQHNPPRTVPHHIFKVARSPIGRFLMFMALFVAVMGVGGAVLARVQAKPVGFLIGALFLLEALVMGGWAIHAERTVRRVLTQGRLYKGVVLKVRPLSAWINGRAFFSVSVRFTDEFGREVIGKDLADSWNVEYFLHARAEQQELDVLYCPNALHKVILPVRLALNLRFD